VGGGGLALLMKYFFNIILLLLVNKFSFCQTTFIDSIFFNVSLTESVKQTIISLKKDSRFVISKVDTITDISDHPYKSDKVGALVLCKSNLTSKPTQIFYSKRRCFNTIDGKPIADCLKWTSTLNLYYKSKRITKREWNQLLNKLRKKLNCKLENGIINEKKECYGYEFHLTESMSCQILSLDIDYDKKIIRIEFN
jgi:hypothetical protein